MTPQEFTSYKKTIDGMSYAELLDFRTAKGSDHAIFKDKDSLNYFNSFLNVQRIRTLIVPSGNVDLNV